MTRTPPTPRHLAWLICLALALLWVSATSFYLMGKWDWQTATVKPTPMWLAQLISIPATTLALYGLYRLADWNRFTVATFVPYALWFGVLFLAFAPGCLTEDSYYTFAMVRNGWWNAWYSVLHPALLTASMQILPFEVYAPGILLASTWAGVFALLHWILRSLAAPRLCHLVPPLLALVPAQLAASMIIIRDSFFTAFFTLFLLAVIHAVRSRITHRFHLVAIGILGGLVMIYRTDALPSVAIGLYAVLAAGPWQGLAARARLKAAMPLLAPVLVSLLFAALTPRLLDQRWIRGNTWDARAKLEYKLTLMENPLGYILRHGGSRITAEEQAAIEKVFRFADLRQHSCPGNLCVFYGNMWNKQSTMTERNRAFRAALTIFAKHPILFMESRIATLNTVGDENTQTLCSRTTMVEKGYPPLYLNQGLFDFGQRVVDTLRRTERVDGIYGGARVWWNVYAYGAVALAIAIAAAWAPAVSLAAALLLLRTVVVAAVAPAGFTVYYLTLFIGTPMLLLLWIAELRSRRRSATA